MRQVRNSDYAKSPLDSWMSSDGTVTKIPMIETSHLASIVALLLRNQRSGRDNLQMHKIVSLKKELVKRLSR